MLHDNLTNSLACDALQRIKFHPYNTHISVRDQNKKRPTEEEEEEERDERTRIKILCVAKIYFDLFLILRALSLALMPMAINFPN